MAKKGVTKEVRILAVITSIYGWLGLLLMIAIGVFAYQYLGVIPGDLKQFGKESNDEALQAITNQITGLLTSMHIFFYIVAILGQLLYILIGSCLKRGKARWLAYLGAIIALFNVPIGLALGVYTFVVLGRKENNKGFA